MAVFTSKINRKSDLFNNNKEDFTKLIKKMEDIHSRAEKVSERRRSKFIERGQLTPRERLSTSTSIMMPIPPGSRRRRRR